MSTADGTVIGTTKILDNGDPVYRFNVVILAEGYQSGQLAQFANDAQAFVTTLGRTAPYHLIMNSFNVYRVDVSSTDSGADDPVACGGSGTTVNTYFDATFCGDGKLQRVLTVNTATAHKVAGDRVPHYHLIIVLVNSAEYGGSGGDLAVCSRAGNAIEIALHEMGHTLCALADEYPTLAGCGSGETGHDNHPQVEPAAANVTVTGANDRSRLKWGRFVRVGTALPTTSNPNCSQCDTRSSPVPAGTVGAFEGADYFHCGAFRPEFDCRMRTLGQPFCRVCQDAILRRLYGYSPLNMRFVWKGVGTDQQLYFGWGGDSDQYSLTGAFSTHAPSVINYMGTLAAWKGGGSNLGIYYSTQNSEDGVTWTAPQNVVGVGTSTGPALAVFQGKLYMAWKGIPGDQGIYFSSYALQWAPQASVPNVGTSTRPALAVYRNRLFMAWKGIEGDQGIYFASYDGRNWTAQAPVPGVGTSTYPTMGVLQDRLYMVWKGIEGDPSVYFTSFDGTAWRPQSAVPNIGTAVGATLSAGPDRLFLTWSGVAGDPSLYYTTFDGSFWGPQHNYLDTGSSSVPALFVYY
jgi:hypothetical protein